MDNEEKASSSKKRRESKLKTTGTKGQDVPKFEKKEEKSSQKKIIVGVLALITLVAGIAVFAVAAGKEQSECEKFLQDLSTGKKVTTPLGPIARGDCIEKACSFDYSQCQLPCPFGFSKDSQTQCPESCDCAVEGSFQGDIQFGENEVPQMMKDYGYVVPDDFELFIGWGGKIWNNIKVGTRFKIPYDMDRDLNEQQYKIFDTTIRNLSRLTCLDFIPRMNDEREYVHVSGQGMGCLAKIGRTGSMQYVQLPPGCYVEAIIQHELAHTLGFQHEQSRKDRDANVDIFWDNIYKHQKHNFDKQSGQGWVDLNSAYELGSAMHYDSYAFTINTMKPSITGKGDVLIEYKVQDNFLSEEDIREINVLYECEDGGAPKSGEWDSWSSWTECTETCGTGKLTRFRYCVHKESGEKLVTGCDGLPSDFKDCNTEPCPPSNATWTEWASWGKCSKTCDKGSRLRSRDCTEVLACGGGFNHYFDHEDCWEADCETGEKITTYAFAEWSSWGPWTFCDKYCGKGEQRRGRDCLFKKEIMRFDRCPYDGTEPGVSEVGNWNFKECATQPCSEEPPATPATQPVTDYPSPVVTPANTTPPAVTEYPGTVGVVPLANTSSQAAEGPGQWGEWSQWSECSVACGSGEIERTRECSAAFCYSVARTTMPCEGKDCSSQPGMPSPADESEWQEWGQWSACDKTCGSGVRERTRVCISQFCPGEATLIEPCEEAPCLLPGEPSDWGEWGQWGSCDRTCGTGTKKRSRQCVTQSCSGPREESGSCQEETCTSAFSNIFSDVSTNFLPNICPYGRLFPGKFDKDSATDLLCLYPDGFARLYFTNPNRGSLAEEISWEGPTIHCSFADTGQESGVYVRDMNNDGLDDLICHNMFTKEIMVTYNKGGAFEPRLDWLGRREKCEFIARFENLRGEDNVDLICGDENNPIQHIYHKKEGGGGVGGFTVGSQMPPAQGPNGQMETAAGGTPGIQIESVYKPPSCPRTVQNGDEIDVEFVGTLITGEEFQSTREHGALTFKLGSGMTIEGFEEGILGMCEKEKRKVTVPPELGYGDEGLPPLVIGPQVLTYDIEVLQIKGQGGEITQLPGE